MCTYTICYNKGHIEAVANNQLRKSDHIIGVAAKHDWWDFTSVIDVSKMDSIEFLDTWSRYKGLSEEEKNRLLCFHDKEIIEKVCKQ